MLGDLHGNLVHLFERECSLQRRHQKIVEESPSPAVTPALRAELTSAALAMARAVGYVNAGTLEFILTPQGKFYFLEMNTRLQVEHPITEVVAAVDIVRWQILIAAGKQLDLELAEARMRGHALECRIYAEDPANDFMPSTGEISCYRPAAGPGVRIDGGIEAGTKISPYYDPMMAKVIVWGADRQEAIRKMSRALQDTVILGVTTNIPYLLDIIDHPDFQAGNLSTSFLQKRFGAWSPAIEAGRNTLLALAAFEDDSESRLDASESEKPEQHPADPWGTTDGWRNVS